MKPTDGFTKLPKHDARSVGSKDMPCNPGLGASTAGIRKEQTRYTTKPSSKLHKEQFPGEKSRQRTLPKK